MDIDDENFLYEIDFCRYKNGNAEYVCIKGFEIYAPISANMDTSERKIFHTVHNTTCRF